MNAFVESTTKEIDAKSEKLLNSLIYAYLNKKKYLGTAKIFSVEANISDPPDQRSVLEEWFSVFNDISLVRSGNNLDQLNMSKIEGIMLKLENEKKKFVKFIRGEKNRGGFDPRLRPPEEYYGRPPIARGYYDGYNKTGERIHPGRVHMPQYYDQRRPPVKPRTYPQRPEGFYEPDPSLDSVLGIHRTYNSHPNIHPPYNPPINPHNTPISTPFPSNNTAPINNVILSEMSVLEYHTQKITSLAISNGLNLLITGGFDKNINIFGFRNSQRICVLEPNGKPVTDVKIFEREGEAYVGVNTLSNEVVLITLGDDTQNIIKSKMVLRGHSSSVTAIEFGDEFLYSVDVDGAMRKWNLSGVCVDVQQVNEGIRSICHVAGDVFIFSDRSGVYIYDQLNKTTIRELVKESAVNVRRCDKKFLVCLKNTVLVYDNKLQRISTISIPGERIHSAHIMPDQDVLIGSYQQIYFYDRNGVVGIKAHEGVISCIGVFTGYGSNIVVTGSHGGDCKLWCYKTEKSDS